MRVMSASLSLQMGIKYQSFANSTISVGKDNVPATKSIRLARQIRKKFQKVSSLKLRNKVRSIS